MANDLISSPPTPVAGRSNQGLALYPFGAPSPPDPDEIRLRDVTGALKRRWPLILFVALVVVGLGGWIIWSLQPLYRADAQLMLDPRRIQVVDLQSVVSSLATGQQLDASVVRSEVAVLQSTSLAQSVAKQLNLTQIPEFNPALMPPTVMQRVREKILTLLTATQAEPAAGRQELTTEQVELLQAANLLMSHVAIVNDGKSYIIDIVVTTTNPFLSARIANAYATTYISDQLKAKLDATERGNTLVADRVGELRERLRKADQDVADFRQANNLVQATGGSVTVQQLTEINNQLSLARSELAEKQSRLREVESLLAGGGVATSASAVLGSPTIQVLRDRQTELERQKADLLSRFGENYPMVATNRAQLQSVQQRLTDEITRIVAGVRGEANAASSKVASLTASLNQLQQRASTDDKVSVRLSELQREAAADRNLYETFLSRSKQTSEEINLQQADARLVSRADPPLGPAFPNRLLFLIFACVVGAGVGGLAAVVAERLDGGFRTAHQVEVEMGVPALGLIPDLGRRAKKQLTPGQFPPTLDEALRTLRTGLRFSNVDDPPQVILITSALAGEGKSYLAVAFARSIAKTGKRVVVIDCDLRRPAIADIVGAPESPGLLAMLTDQPTVDITFHENSSGVDFITVPQGITHTPELLGSNHMQSFLQSQRKMYDVIILDAPPMLPVSDALVLSEHADAALFVVRWGKTKRYLASVAVRSLLMRGRTVAGVVLTRVNLKRYGSYKDSATLSLPSATPYFPYK